MSDVEKARTDRRIILSSIAGLAINAFVAIVTLFFGVWAVRNISPDSVSVFAAFMALANVIGLSFSGLQTSLVRAVAKETTLQDSESESSRPEQKIIVLALILATAILFASPAWNSLIGLSGWVVVSIVASPINLAMHSILVARLVSAGKFATVSTWALLTALTNVLGQLGLELVISPTLESVLMNLTAVNFILGVSGLVFFRNFSIQGVRVFSKESISAAFLTLAASLAMQGDLLIAGIVLDSESRDSYAVASLMVKAGVFLASSLNVTVFRLLLQPDKRVNRKKRITMGAGLMTLGLGGSLALGAAVWPYEIISTFYGEDWAPSSALMLPVTLAALPVLIVGPFTQYATVNSSLSFATLALIVPALFFLTAISFVSSPVGLSIFFFAQGAVFSLLMFYRFNRRSFVRNKLLTWAK